MTILIGTVVVIAFYIGLSAYEQYLQNRISSCIYGETDYEQAEALLHSGMANLLIPKRTRCIIKLDILIAKEAYEDLGILVKKAEQNKLSDMNLIGLYQKLLSFYALQGKADEAEHFYQKLCLITKQKKHNSNPQISGIQAEADQLIEVYIRHNTDYIKTIESILPAVKSPVYQGIYRYRMAKLYYYKNDEAQCRECLTQAKALLKGSKMEQWIQEMLNDNLTFMEFK